MMDDDGIKWISSGVLSKLLDGIPSDALVCVNTVGNLLVKSTDSSYYVDFLEETINKMGE